TLCPYTTLFRSRACWDRTAHRGVEERLGNRRGAVLGVSRQPRRTPAQAARPQPHAPIRSPGGAAPDAVACELDSPRVGARARTARPKRKAVASACAIRVCAEAPPRMRSSQTGAVDLREPWGKGGRLRAHPEIEPPPASALHVSRAGRTVSRTRAFRAKSTLSQLRH